MQQKSLDELVIDGKTIGKLLTDENWHKHLD
jgi:hypothetical protein